MPKVKFILTSIIIGLIAVGFSELLQRITNWRGDWIMPPLMAVWIGGWLWYESRHSHATAVQNQDADCLHWTLFQMAAGLLVFIMGMVGLNLISEPYKFVAGGIGVLGFIGAIPAVVRYNEFIKAARHAPALMDERIAENAGKSERWAFLACFEIALILGMIDYLDMVQITGATVGFSAGVGGVFVGIMAQAYYEWRDGK